MIQILLVMSHGQAGVEQGFSVNKQVMVENRKEESGAAQRVIVDGIRAAGGLEKVTITKELQTSASCARQRYVAYFGDKTKEQSKSNADQRKSSAGELQELKRKKNRLESDIQQLEQSADEFAEKAEATQKYY